jgi:hypothetical protein
MTLFCVSKQKTMKKISVLVLALFAVLLSNAQKAGYTISVDKQPFVQGSYETAEATVVKIKKNLFKKAKLLGVKMTGELAAADKRITLLVMDDAGTTYTQKEADATDSTLSIEISQIKNALMTGKVLKLYSITLPKDPALAAAIRPKRMMMASLQMVNK